ncbi:MAG: hypothetical protein V4717_09260 [Bacteroidota bacterium]
MKKGLVTNLLLLLLTCSNTLHAQFKPPTGPVFDAMVKAYVASFSTGETDGVKAQLPAMEKAFPGHPYTIFFQAFYQHASGNDLQAAMKGYSDAIRLMPEFSDPYVKRASLFADRGMYERAVADIDKAILAEGKNADAGMYSDRADFKMAANDVAGAFEDMKRAISLAPSVARFYRGASNIAFKLGNQAAMEPLFTTALNGTQSGNGEIHMEYATYLMRSQQLDKAGSAYKKAMAGAGFIPTSKDYNTAGIIAYKLKDYPAAALLLDKGIALDGRDADMICNRASVAIDQQKWEEVYQYAQKALAADAKNASANMMMAIGIKRTNRGDALAASYEAKAKQFEAGN